MSAQLRLWSGDTTSLDPEAPIVLSIRESARARQLILQVLPPRTIEVVVPRGARPRIVESFISGHSRWIEKAGRELLAAYPDPQLSPDSIELSATGTCVAVRYRDGGGRAPHYRYRSDELSLFGVIDDAAGTLDLLRRWLLREAKQLLPAWLARESRRIGLAPDCTQIRLQKTRWGSCSARGAISLNAALLLVPPELVRYLLVHELCHLQHMSHSRRYWQLVAKHEPDYRTLDRRLAASWQELPGWVFALAHGGSGR